MISESNMLGKVINVIYLKDCRTSIVYAHIIIYWQSIWVISLICRLKHGCRLVQYIYKILQIHKAT